MIKKITLVLIGTAVVSVLVGCNIYAPFTTKNNDNDYIEEAEKCLKNNDLGCAIENYQLMSDGDPKNIRLCVSYLSRAGFTANLMLNVLSKNSSTVLGDLANALAPWSDGKTSDAVTAFNYCSVTAGNSGILLKSIALFVDCALRVAKTDQLLGSSPTDTACTTPGGNDGVITKADIGDSGVGMCVTDITQCGNDLSGIDPSALNNAGLSGIQSAISQVPAALKDPSVSASAGRSAIQSTLAN